MLNWLVVLHVVLATLKLLLAPGTFTSLDALGGNPFCANIHLTLKTAKNSLLWA